jgi:hypothetical protein
MARIDLKTSEHPELIPVIKSEIRRLLAEKPDEPIEIYVEGVFSHYKIPEATVNRLVNEVKQEMHS